MSRTTRIRHGVLLQKVIIVGLAIARISTGFCINGISTTTARSTTTTFSSTTTASCSTITAPTAFHITTTSRRTHHSNRKQQQHPSRLFNSLKPAAVPLMDAGKALARSGELLIELTTAMDIYGGSLSSVGAQVRNAGDSVAQAAASCRFKTGVELVTDELRESGTCLTEAVAKLERAIQEAKADNAPLLATNLEAMVEPMKICGQSLEAAGATLLQRQAISQAGQYLSRAGKALEKMSVLIPDLNDDSLGLPNPDGVLSGQRMALAAEKMMQAGDSLQGVAKEKPKSKSWLKGGM